MGEVNEEKCTMIEGFFEQYGWTYNRGNQMGIWYTGFRGNVASFNITVQVMEWTIFFIVEPYVLGPSADEEAFRNRLHKHLLNANLDIASAKFSLNKDRDVALTIEFPCDSPETFQFTEFDEAIGLTCHACDKHYIEVLRLANEENAPSKYLDVHDDVDI